MSRVYLALHTRCGREGRKGRAGREGGEIGRARFREIVQSIP